MKTVIPITHDPSFSSLQAPYNSSISYYDVQQSFDHHSVRFYVFSEYETLNKDGKEPVLGINFDSTLLTTKRVSADDIAKLKLPKGHYAKMATASKGRCTLIYANLWLIYVKICKRLLNF